MQTTIKTLFAAALAGAALFTGLPASADGGRHWDRHERGEWRDDHPGRGHGWGHHKHWRHHHYVERDRVVIRERPVYRDYYYYEAPVRYYEPPVRYSYPRNPAIVIGLDVPPLVIPLR